MSLHFLKTIKRIIELEDAIRAYTIKCPCWCHEDTDMDKLPETHNIYCNTIFEDLLSEPDELIERK